MAVVARPRRSYTFGTVLRYVLLAVVVIYLVLPLFSTILFSLATVWSKTILPEGYTLNAYRESFNDPQIVRGIQRSLTATVATLFVGLALVVPALLWVHLRAPSSNVARVLAIVPWALPGVVLALAVIRTYISPYNVSRPWCWC